MSDRDAALRELSDAVDAFTHDVGNPAAVVRIKFACTRALAALPSPDAADQETFTDRIRKIEHDLMSIVDRMNRDYSFEAATAAQIALRAVNHMRHVETSLDFDDLPWDWQPGEDAT